VKRTGSRRPPINLRKEENKPSKAPHLLITAIAHKEHTLGIIYYDRNTLAFHYHYVMGAYFAKMKIFYTVNIDN